MIITLKNANFSLSNIGTLNTWSIIRSLGVGASYSGPTYVNKNATFNATVTLSNEYDIGENGITVIMNGVDLGNSAYSINEKVITITIASVTGNIHIVVATKNIITGEENAGDPTSGWNKVFTTFEVGTTKDDETGTMGNKVSNANRLRTYEAIRGDLVKIKMPIPDGTLYVWYNIFDDNGTLVKTSNKTVTSVNGELIVNVKGAGGTQIWPIFKEGVNGTTPVTDEHKNTINIYAMNLDNDLINLNLELGTFSDSTGEKIDNVARLRNANRIAVPSTATGMLFIPTGTFDMWVKGYSSADVTIADVCNGISATGNLTGGAYWNTSYKGQNALTWAKISGGVRPAYIDLVFKADSVALLPSDGTGLVVGFI